MKSFYWFMIVAAVLLFIVTIMRLNLGNAQKVSWCVFDALLVVKYVSCLHDLKRNDRHGN